MPEDTNQETKELELETPVENLNDGEKRRIKPVIEEVPSEADETPIEAVDDQPMPEAQETQAPEVQEPHTSEDHDHHSPDEPKGDLKLFILVSIITALVVAVLAGGVYVYMTGTKKSDEEALVIPTPTPAIEENTETDPEASAAPSMKPSEYKVQILNGSGKIGEANAAKTLVEAEGFKVGNTGNAATFDFEDTEISVKSSVSDETVEMIKEALSSKYSVVIGDKLTSSSEYDIVITIGSK